MPQFLNFIIARQVKAAIWTGARYSEIASHFAISQPTVSNIANGKTWGEVPWPDDSSGALSIEQRQIIQGLRYKGQGTAFTPHTASPLSVRAPGLSPALDPRAVEAEIERQQMLRDTEAMKAIMAPPTEKDLDDERRAQERRAASDVEDKPISLDEEFWEMLLAKHSTNPLVDVAMNSTVEARIAVVEAFKNLPEEQWTSDMAQRMIRAALRDLLSSNAS